MNYIAQLIEELKNRIDRRITRLNTEITDICQRQKADEIIYGIGGAYRRKEMAIQKRMKEIDELQEFIKQLNEPIITEEIIYTTLYCKECHSEILSWKRLTGNWHECPVCRKMIYRNIGKQKIKMVKG